jgi:hypothetical protein
MLRVEFPRYPDCRSPNLHHQPRHRRCPNHLRKAYFRQRSRPVCSPLVLSSPLIRRRLIDSQPFGDHSKRLSRPLLLLEHTPALRLTVSFRHAPDVPCLGAHDLDGFCEALTLHHRCSRMFDDAGGNFRHIDSQQRTGPLAPSAECKPAATDHTNDAQSRHCCK